MPVVFNVLTGIPQALSSIQMIIICCATDVLPALSLVREQPEADLLLRKPRNRKRDRLADWKLLIHAYFFLGVLESLTSFTGQVLLYTKFRSHPYILSHSAFFFGFKVQNGIGFSRIWLKYGGVDDDLAPNFAEFTNQAQAVCSYPFPTPLGKVLTRFADFFNLVVMQWFNLMATRTRRLSIFQQNPFGRPETRNLYLFPAMGLALAIGLFVQPSSSHLLP